MEKLKVMTIFGTRPEAIKMAPVILELKNFSQEIEVTVTVTAQHREMLDQVLNLFDIRPDYDLNIMSAGQTLFDITSRALLGLNKVLEEVKPQIVLVHGDTTTTFAGALAAYYHQISVGHVEAGLRTGNKFSPYINHAGKTILVTTHRRENWGEPLRQVYKALKKILDEFADVKIIFPVHKNPVVRDVVNEELGNLPRVHLTDPLDYEPFANLMSRVDLILTDSGGVQEEAPALGKPVLVLRNTTERPEAVNAGTVKLVGTNFENVFQATKLLLTDADEYKKMSDACNPYGDGIAAKRIVQAILWHYKLADEKPVTFQPRR